MHVLPLHVLTWGEGQGATHGDGSRMPRLQEISGDQLVGNGRATNNVALPFPLAAGAQGAMAGRVQDLPRLAGAQVVDIAIEFSYQPWELLRSSSGCGCSATAT
jgi:hypothetical protein